MEGIVFAHLLGAETVELLIFGKERAIRKRRIEPSDRVETVIGYHEVVSGVSNSFDVARGDIARCTDKSEVEHRLEDYMLRMENHKGCCYHPSLHG